MKKITLVALAAITGQIHPMTPKFLNDRAIKKNTSKNTYLNKISNAGFKKLQKENLVNLLKDEDINTKLEEIFGQITNTSLIDNYITFINKTKKEKSQLSTAINTLRILFRNNLTKQDVAVEVNMLLNNPLQKNNLKRIIYKLPKRKPNKKLPKLFPIDQAELNKLQLLLPLVYDQDIFYNLAFCTCALYGGNDKILKTYYQDHGVDHRWIFDDKFNTPLTIACGKGYDKIVQYLLTLSYVSPNETNLIRIPGSNAPLRQSALQLAAENRKIKCIKLLMKNPKIKPINNKLITAKKNNIIDSLKRVNEVETWNKLKKLEQEYDTVIALLDKITISKK